MEKLEFKNTFGQLFESHFKVTQSGQARVFAYDQFRKIRLYKFRDYQLNFLLFGLSFATGLIGFMLRAWDSYMIVLGCCLSLVLFYFSYRSKKYRYELQMVTVQYEPIVMEVHANAHEDAKTIVRKLNRKLKEQTVYLKVV